MKKLSVILLTVFITASLLSGCGDQKKPSIPDISRIPVVMKSAKDSRAISSDLIFPGIFNSKGIAKIYSKVNGTAKDIKFNVGQQVSAGDLLIKIDDYSGLSYGTGFNAGPLNQAKLASEQAAVAYKTAQIAYQNFLDSSEKDIKQTEISKNQAETGEMNTQAIVSNTVSSAKIAYDTVKISVEQAKIALDDRKASAQEALDDANTNADLAATSVINISNTIITSVNNLTGFDDSNSVSVPYRSYLGAYDQKTYNQAFNSYRDTKSYYKDFLNKDFADTSEKISQAILLAEKVKDMVDSAKLLLDNTVSGALLPLSSQAGVSLTGIQSTIFGYQTQINTALLQANQSSQGLSNVILNNNTSLNALEKAYELAKQQEKNALQNLETVNNSTKSQLDQAGFGKQQAVTAYESAKIKMNSQLSASRAQMDSARLQYENSLVALNNLISNYQVVSPISGKITQKLISEGETVSPGQLLFAVGNSDEMKIQFYVDFSTMQNLSVGYPVTFQSNDGVSADGKITAISSSADDTTKRFQIEAVPVSSDAQLAPGTVVDVLLKLEIKPTIQTDVMVPLSAINFGQNGNTIFINEQSRAKIVSVNLVNIIGENAEIKADLSDESLIVIRGNQLVHEGDFLTEQQ